MIFALQKTFGINMGTIDSGGASKKTTFRNNVFDFYSKGRKCFGERESGNIFKHWGIGKVAAMSGNTFRNDFTRTHFMSFIIFIIKASFTLCKKHCK